MSKLKIGLCIGMWICCVMASIGFAFQHNWHALIWAILAGVWVFLLLIMNAVIEHWKNNSVNWKRLLDGKVLGNNKGER